MRPFIALLDNNELRKELEELKHLTDKQFQIVFEAIKQLLSEEDKPKKIYPVKSICSVFA